MIVSYIHIVTIAGGIFYVFLFPFSIIALQCKKTSFDIYYELVFSDKIAPPVFIWKCFNINLVLE